MNINSSAIRALRIAATLAAFAIPPLSAGTASARALPAQAGHAFPPADATCFAEAWGSAKNVCGGGARFWLMPLVIDPAGYVNPVVTVFAPTPSNTVGCYVYGVQHTATNTFTFWQSNTLYPSQFGVATTLAPVGAWVPAGGYGMAVCMVNSGGQVNGVVY